MQTIATKKTQQKSQKNETLTQTNLEALDTKPSDLLSQSKNSSQIQKTAPSSPMDTDEDHPIVIEDNSL